MLYLYLYNNAATNGWKFGGVYEAPMSLKQWTKCWNGPGLTEEIEVMDGTDILPIVELYKRSEGKEVSVRELMKIPGTVSLKGNRFYTKEKVVE